MTKNVIELPEGKTEVSFSEIPWLIAKAITPEEIANTIKIVAIRKRHIPADMPYDEETVSEVIPEEDLTDYDWKRLNLICEFADLPILWQRNAITDINLSDWGEYEKAIKEKLPEWELIPYSNRTLNIIANRHMTYLEDAIKNNIVVMHDHLTRIPLQQPINLFALEKAYMTVNDFIKYAKQFKLNITIDSNKTTSASPEQLNSPSDMPPPCMGSLNSINELAVKVAWKIEKETGVVPVKPKLVIAKLRDMVTTKDPKYSFLKSLSEHGVNWATTTHKESEYDIGACAATLRRWYKRRNAQASNNTIELKN